MTDRRERLKQQRSQPRSNAVAELVLWNINALEGGEETWVVDVEFSGRGGVTLDREFNTPGQALDYARKWAADRQWQVNINHRRIGLSKSQGPS